MAMTQEDLLALVRMTCLALFAALLSQSILPVGSVKAFLKAHKIHSLEDAEWVVALIVGAVETGVNDLVGNLGTQYHGYDLKSHDAAIDTKLQGTYIAILINTLESLMELLGLYVGSSYGEKGVENRVRNNHQKASYRLKNPKLLYTAMDMKGVLTHFCLLAKFRERVEEAVTLIAESTFANIFGSWQSAQHLKIRADILPKIMPWIALNRTEPLIGWDKYASFRKAQSESQGHDLLLRTRQSGVWRIRHSVCNGSKTWRVYMSHFSFTIPSALAKAWKLEDEPWVTLDFQVTEDPHPAKWAKAAWDADDASRLAIEISHDVNGRTESDWLERDELSGVAMANSFVDWLTGKIENVNHHVWPRDRFPFFGPLWRSVKITDVAEHIQWQRDRRLGKPEPVSRLRTALKELTQPKAGRKRKAEEVEAEEYDGNEYDEGEEAHYSRQYWQWVGEATRKFLPRTAERENW